MIPKKLEQHLEQLPEIVAGKDVWQNPFHEYDVYNHTMHMVDAIKQLTDDKELIVAAYLHDIGKSTSTELKMKDGKVQEKFPGKPYHEFDDHEYIGEKMVREMTYTFFQEFDINQEHVAKLVGAHFTPMKGIKEMRKTTDYDSFLKKYDELKGQLDATGLPRKEIMTMFSADCTAKGKGCTDIVELSFIKLAIMNNDKGIKEAYLAQQQYHQN